MRNGIQRHAALLIAGLFASAVILLISADTQAAAHPYFNVCQVSALASPGTATVRCQFLHPPNTPFSPGEFVADLSIHTLTNPTSTHDWARLPNRNGWNWMYSNNTLGTYCPQVNVKALCSKSNGTWNSPLTYEQGWYALGLSYTFQVGSGDTPNLNCPSDRPYMLNGNLDTQMFW